MAKPKTKNGQMFADLKSDLEKIDKQAHAIAASLRYLRGKDREEAIEVLSICHPHLIPEQRAVRTKPGQATKELPYQSKIRPRSFGADAGSIWLQRMRKIHSEE